MANKNKNFTDVYTHFWFKNQGDYRGPTCDSVEEAKKICNEKFNDGAFMVEYYVYKKYKFLISMKKTSRKPYWHESGREY